MFQLFALKRKEEQSQKNQIHKPKEIKPNENKDKEKWLDGEMKVYDIIKGIDKVHEALKPRYFRMDELVRNPGLNHLPKQIIFLLDFKTIGRCRLVSKAWKNLIDEDKLWWFLQCEKAQRTEFFEGDEEDIYGFPETYCLLSFYSDWSEVNNHLFKQALLKDYKSFAEFMIEFVLDEKKQRRRSEIASPLHYAASIGRLDVFEWVANSPFENVNLPRNLRMEYDDEEDLSLTPLGIASFQGHLDIVKFMLELKGSRAIDINSSEPTGYSPFHEACRSGNKEVVSLFFEYEEIKNLDVNKLTEFGETALGEACNFRTGDAEVVKLLLKHPQLANINVPDSDGDTALHIVCNVDISSFDRPCSNWLTRGRCQDAQIIELFLQHPDIDLSLVDQNGRTPLHLVCLNECPVKLEVFLKFKQIDVNARDNDGRTFIHLAFLNDSHRPHICWSSRGRCQFGRNDRVFTIAKFSPVTDLVLRYSKELGIPRTAFELQDNDGRTPLHLMYMTRCNVQTKQFLQEVVKEYGIEFNTEALDNDGKTPRQLVELQRANNAKKFEARANIKWI